MWNHATEEEKEAAFKLFCEIEDEAHAAWDPFKEFIKTCSSYSYTPFCNHPPPYDYRKDGRPYSRCLKTGGYCKQLECPDYKAWLNSKKGMLP